MAKARLFQAVCVAAMLAAAPAIAQTDTQPADTGANNSVNAPEAPNAGSTGGSAPTPAGKMGTDTMPHHHRAVGAMHAKTEVSQDAAVDHLNDQSYQAAQRGEAFNGSGGAPSDAAGTGVGASGK